MRRINYGTNDSQKSDPCEGLFGRWFGHNFQTQAILGPVDLSLLESIRVGPGSVDALRTVHKVVTLCTRCGLKLPGPENEGNAL